MPIDGLEGGLESGEHILVRVAHEAVGELRPFWRLAVSERHLLGYEFDLPLEMKCQVGCTAVRTEQPDGVDRVDTLTDVAGEVAQQVLTDGERRPRPAAWLVPHLHTDEAVARLPAVELLGPVGQVIPDVHVYGPPDLPLDGLDVVEVNELLIRGHETRVRTDRLTYSGIPEDPVPLLRADGPVRWGVPQQEQPRRGIGVRGVLIDLPRRTPRGRIGHLNPVPRATDPVPFEALEAQIPHHTALPQPFGGCGSFPCESRWRMRPSRPWM
jgi:hypothetical protein